MMMKKEYSFFVLLSLFFLFYLYQRANIPHKACSNPKPVRQVEENENQFREGIVKVSKENAAAGVIVVVVDDLVACSKIELRA